MEETLKKLYAKVLVDNQRSPFAKLNIPKVVDELMAINKMSSTEMSSFEESEKKAELDEKIKRLDEAKATVAELSPIVESMRVELKIPITE